MNNSTKRNQCDGCQAGVPLEDGKHRMGRPGGYPDLMSCTAHLYGAPQVQPVAWAIFDGAWISDHTADPNRAEQWAEDGKNVIALFAMPVQQPVSAFARDVLAERQRQILQEGFSPNHDAEHRGGELALAATCYADEAVTQICQPEREPCLTQLVPGWWPFEPSWWKPSLDVRKNLVKATALLLAQGDAIDLQIDIELEGRPHG